MGSNNCIGRVVCNAGYVGPNRDGDPWKSQPYDNNLLNSKLRQFCLAKNIDLVVALAAKHADVLLFYYTGDTILYSPVPTDFELDRMKAYSDRLKIFGLGGEHLFARETQEIAFQFVEKGPDVLGQVNFDKQK